MKQLKLTMMLITLAAFIHNGNAQVPGSSSLNPIVVPAGTTSLINQGTAFNEKWYKFSLTNPIFYLRTILKNQGHQFPLTMGEFYAYDQTGNPLRYRKDSLLTDTVLLFSYETTNISDQIYLKLTFDTLCNSCSDSTRFDFQIFEFNESSCPPGTVSCEYVENGSFENTILPCGLIGLNQGSNLGACQWNHALACAPSQSFGTSDYYNSCAPVANYNLNYFFQNNIVTYNFWTSPHTGNAYVGLFLYGAGDYREYVYTSLAAPLSTSLTYTFSMWVKASNVSNFSNGLEVILTNSALCQPGPIEAGTSPGQIFTVTPSVINFTTWANFTFTFTPTSNWDQMLIGNFMTNATTSVVSNPNGAAPFFGNASAYVYIDDVSITAPPPNATANALPTNICVGQTSTLTASSPSPNVMSYVWTPGGLTGSAVAVNPNSTTIYTLTATNQTGCVTTATTSVLVLSLPTVSATASASSICNGHSSTLTANSPDAIIYTWSPGGFLGNPYVVNPGQTTTYTVTAMNGNGCTSQAFVTVSVNTVPPSFTTAYNPFFCIPTHSSAGSVVLTASPAGTYSLEAPTLPLPTFTQFSSSVVINPTGTSNYTVLSYDPNGCLTNAVITLTQVPCQCLAVNAPTVGGIYSGQNAFQFTNFQSKLKVVSDVTLNLSCSTNLQLANTEYIVYPGVKITITSNAEAIVPILGSYFHGCGEMWEGIVSPNADSHIAIDSYTTGVNSLVPTLIEDAKVGLTLNNSISNGICISPNPQNAYYLRVSSAIFNKCITGIQIINSTNTIYPVPYLFTNNLFTSRNLNVVPGIGNAIATWPAINTVKNSASGLSSMETPYINNTSYPPVQISSLLYSYIGFPQCGILLNNVGFTDLTQSPPVYSDITIGGGGVPNFNCFDHMVTDINAINSNLTVFNSVFQYGIRNGKNNLNGGVGIEAISLSNNKNHLRVYGGPGNGNFPCRFYDKTVGVDANDYFDIEAQNAKYFSFLNNYILFSQGNSFGGKGVNILTSRYRNINIQSSEFHNIKNAMMITVDNASNSLGLSREIGQINVQTNTVDLWVGTVPGGSSPYVNIGTYIADPINVPASITFNTPVDVNVVQNSYVKVHNGVSVMNFAQSPVVVLSNTISMVNEPPLFNPNPVQKGIFGSLNTKFLTIHTNSITGPSVVWGDSLKGIMSVANGSLSVRCNTTANTARGIEFDHVQYTDFFEDNNIIGTTIPNPSSAAFGLVLDHNAVLSGATTTIGTGTRPTDNLWQEPWPNSGGFKTMTYQSDAKLSRLFIQYFTLPALNPANSAGTDINNGNVCPFEFSYLICNNQFNSTLFNANIIENPTCRISGGHGNGNGNGGGNVAARTLLEDVVSNNITFNNNVTEAQHISKTYSYRSLKSNPSIMAGSNVLSNFFVAAQSDNLQKMVSIEENLANNNLNTAQSLISTLTPTNNIESNYKTYYLILKNVKDTTFNSNDSLNLITLANLCPYIDGMVVFQARVLYNKIYRDYFKYTDNCGGNNQQTRLLHNEKAVNQFHSIGQSIIYPNPNNGIFTVKSLSQNEKENVEISIFDLTGRRVVKENKNIGNGEELNYLDLQNGSYVLRLKFENGTIDVHKLIINK